MGAWQESERNYSCISESVVLFRVCLVGVKIIFPENNFPILHCLVKEEGENYFPGKIDFSHLKKILFLKKNPVN